MKMNKTLYLTIALVLILLCFSYSFLKVSNEKNELITLINDLKNENKKLKLDLIKKSENNIIDSLIFKINKSDSIIKIKEKNINNLEIQLKNEKLNNITNPHNTTNYSFSAVSSTKNN